MQEFIFENDPYHMNWVESDAEWGTAKLPKGLTLSQCARPLKDGISEAYTFTNTTDRYIFTGLRDVAIYTPFSDRYESAEICMTNRCHTHIWCGGDVTYIMALRMGGEAPHFGLALTEGSIGGYSIERDFNKGSNDRGVFLLHPSPKALAPGESFTVGWRLFSHNGKDDFYKKLEAYSNRYIGIRAEKYVFFQGEQIRLQLSPAFPFHAGNISVTCGGRDVDYIIKNNTILIDETAGTIGERQYTIDICGVKTWCRILVQPPLWELAKARCYFIADKQQFHKKDSPLDGAYLCYDNEEHHMFYSHLHDYNAGRERFTMGILMAKYLQNIPDSYLENSLRQYITFIEREMFDTQTGVVYNDYGRNNSWNRLYNYPWLSTLYLELYRLYRNQEMLLCAYRALRSFYEQGGTHFYAIEIPLKEITLCLEQENLVEEQKILMRYFSEHCQTIMGNGLNYPAHEVNYEQSIVGPAANLLMQMYEVTEDRKYLEAAKQQLEVLELFNGQQPDYHLYEVAIRHWDGHYFGKRRLFGDTFPHYWSGITATAYQSYADITGSSDYLQKADAACRALLSMFSPDGSATCAYLYPVSINGQKGDFADPYANDQDWALYFNLS